MNNWLLTSFISLLLLACSATPVKDEEAREKEFKLMYSGTEYIIDYSKYGHIEQDSSDKYAYIIKDLNGLREAAGIGVFPNINTIKSDTLFQRLKKEKRVNVDRTWDLENDPNAPQVEKFYSWATAHQDWGTRQFFAAKALEKSGNILQAVKAYYATIIHFPKAVCWNEDLSGVWYVALAAMNELKRVLEEHDLGLEYVDNYFRVKRGWDANLEDDVFTVKVGRLIDHNKNKLIGRVNPNGAPPPPPKDTRDQSIVDIKLELQHKVKSLFLDYSKYGKFINNKGKGKFEYQITDSIGLANAVGEGIYPNTSSLYENPQYELLKENNWLENGNWNAAWAYPYSPYRFFNFATGNFASDGEKQFFTAFALMHAAELHRDPELAIQAIHAYYAVLLHYPAQYSWASERAYLWFIGIAALTKIKGILQDFPELDAELEESYFFVENGYDVDTTNDIAHMELGRIIPKHKFKTRAYKKNPKVSRLRCGGDKPANYDCKAPVYLKQYDNKQWELIVDGEPTVVKGITYTPTKVGESPHDFTLRNWMRTDDNGNGKIDSPYETWVDKNGNNIQDEDEPTVGDFQLMADMGVNAIRYYNVPSNVGKPKQWYNPKYYNKELLRDMTKNYGIKVIMGDMVGSYTVGSGGDWFIGTDYTDKRQTDQMKQIVRDMVMDNKDEPYVLMWLLGNENNMINQYNGVNATHTLASVHPEAWAKFLNEVAGMIHEIDPNHPVAVGNQGFSLLEYYGKYTPNLDIIGSNVYRGKEGFGDLYYYVMRTNDRPLMITEYGSDAINFGLPDPYDPKSQADYHAGCLRDLQANYFGKGTGNSIGGVAFEWVDEWWKSHKGPKSMQDVVRDSPYAFQDGFGTEEFFGITGQGSGMNSPYQRVLRDAYFMYQSHWNPDAADKPYLR